MEKEFIKRVSLELKFIRLENDDNQGNLALKSGVATSTICRYEAGTTNMDLYKIKEILKPYNVSLEDFFKRVLAKIQ
jgi:transcriptional regulator with XRE-family HTH domain